MNDTVGREPKVGKVFASMSVLSESLHTLEDLTNDLESRLEPILSPAVPVDALRSEDEKVTEASLVMDIKSSIERVDKVTDRLRGIHNRLEI